MVTVALLWKEGLKYSFVWKESTAFYSNTILKPSALHVCIICITRSHTCVYAPHAYVLENLRKLNIICFLFFISYLKVLYNMFWWYLHPSPQLFAESSYFPIYQTLCLFFFSFLNLQDQFVLLKSSSIVVFLWSAVDVPGTEKNNLASPSYQLPVAPWLGMGLCANSFLHTEIRSHQGLCMPLKPLWVHVCRCSAVSRR